MSDFCKLHHCPSINLEGESGLGTEGEWGWAGAHHPLGPTRGGRCDFSATWWCCLELRPYPDAPRPEGESSLL